MTGRTTKPRLVDPWFQPEVIEFVLGGFGMPRSWLVRPLDADFRERLEREMKIKWQYVVNAIYSDERDGRRVQLLLDACKALTSIASADIAADDAACANVLTLAARCLRGLNDPDEKLGTARGGRGGALDTLGAFSFIAWLREGSGFRRWTWPELAALAKVHPERVPVGLVAHAGRRFRDEYKSRVRIKKGGLVAATALASRAADTLAKDLLKYFEPHADAGPSVDLRSEEPGG